MKLIEINFNSFRSLKNENLVISNNCLSFIGLNEGGKTNVLTGIRTLNSDYVCTEEDISEIDGSKPNIDFIFEPEKEDHEKIKEWMKQWFVDNTFVRLQDCFVLSGNIINKIVKIRGLKDDNKELTNARIEWSQNCKNNLVILDEDKWTSDEQITINEENISFKNAKILKRSQVSENYLDFYSDIDTNKLKDVLWSDFIKLLNSFIPKVVYWEYDEEYLIKPEITYEEFLEGDDPMHNNRPLYNIFISAAGLKIKDEGDLKNKIEEWKKNSGKRKRDELIIKTALNKHIRTVWEEYDQEIDIKLEEDKITVHVCDPKKSARNYYKMEQRSQGFQSFVSFLLTISLESKLKYLENYILILDEPEVHLHPSGVRFMKNELLKLAENNYVFFATHSIFMIDREELERHIITRKEGEMTFLQPVQKNTITQEAVLYEALGTTVDEFSMATNNIIFEGEADRKLFDFYDSECHKLKDRKYTNHSLFNGGGVQQIEKFFKSKIISKESKWLIILDNDGAGKRVEEELSKNSFISDNINFKYYGKEGIELEDLLPKDILSKSLNEAIDEFDDSHEFKGFSNNLIMPQIKEIANIIFNQDPEIKNKSKAFVSYFKNVLEKEIDKDLASIKSSKKTKDGIEKYFKKRYKKYVDFVNS